MSISNSLGILTPALLLAACTDASITTEDELSSDEQAAESQMRWNRATGCAISIAVAPDNTIWVVGCESSADSNIWYMQVKDVPGELITEEVWTMTNGRAHRVVVDNAGEPEGVTNAGAVLFNLVTTKNVGGKAIFMPGLNWKTVGPEVPRFPCVMDLGVIHLENYMLFHTENSQERDHSYYSLRCPSSRGNGIFMWIDEQPNQDVSQVQWTPTSQLAKSLAFFAPSQLGDQSLGKAPWILDSDGKMWSNIPGTNQFTSRTTTPTLAIGLTDHFALASGGVYEWSDAGRGSWKRVIENTTPTGTITQITRSGAVAITMPDGSYKTVGPSALWAIDNTGAIYWASQSGVIR